MAFEDEGGHSRAVDAMAMEADSEDAELEAMFSSYEEQHLTPPPLPASPTLSDEEYDDIFAELILQEKSQSRDPQKPADQMDMS